MSVAEAIAERFDGWTDVPFVVREVFGDASPTSIAEELETFCVERLGAGIDRLEFFRASVGSVHGLRLRDGRRVVVKAVRPGSSAARLEAIQEVQLHLATNGFPCPQPLAGPAALGRTVAVAELVLEGAEADPYDPVVRRTMTRTLADLVTACRPFAANEAFRREPQTGLWPRPHEGRFDFEATSAGAEWIDSIAADALSILASSPGEVILGHSDWRIEHLRFANGTVVAVYDWDSLALDSEPTLVGGAAHQFSSDWSHDRRQFPTLAEALGFIADYESARGEPFTEPETRKARGCLVYSMAYTARCVHSDLLTDFGRRAPSQPASLEPERGSPAAFLAAHAAELLHG